MNTNNIKTGNVNIPGPLHSTASDSQDQIGNVVAYAGDIYDTTLQKNQSQINQELLGSSGSGGATYSAGTGISISNNTISVNTGELSYTDLLNKPRLATVATTGYFEDLRINPFIYDISAYNQLQRVGSFAQGTDSVYASGNAHAEGDNTTAYLSSHAEGKDTLADGSHSHAEGRGIIFDTLTLSPSDRYYYNNATSKLYIFLDQSTKSAYNNVPIGAEVTLSFDEGGAFPESYVSNKYCYLEQDDSKTPVLEISGIRSNGTISAFYDNSSYVQGEGYKFSQSATIKFRTSSRGNWSHTEGYGTNASGDYSHAGGYCTVTTNEYEVAFGKYNVSEQGTIFSVGCGDWDDSDISNNNYGLDEYGLNEYNLNKNALMINEYGNVYLKDVGGYDGTSQTTNRSLTLQYLVRGTEGIEQTKGNIVIATSPYSEFYSANRGAEDNVIIGNASIEYTQLYNPGSFKRNVIVGNDNNLNNSDRSAVSGSVIFGNDNNVTGGVCIGLSNTNQSIMDARSTFTLLGTRLTAGDSTNITYNYNFIPYATVIGVNNNPTTFNGIYSSYQNGDWTDAGAFEVGAGKNNTSVSILAQKSDGNLYIKGVGGWDGMSPVKDRKSINTIISEFETRIAALESQIAALTNNQ